MDGSKKTNKEKPDERRDNEGIARTRTESRATSKRGSQPKTVAARPRDSKNSSHRVHKEQSPHGAEERPVAQPGAGQNSRRSSGNYFSVGNSNGSNQGDKIISRKAKERILMFLDAVILLGVLGTVILALVLLGRLNEQAEQARRDSVRITAIVEADLRCLGTFFSLTNRQDLKIVDLRTCRIVNVSTGEALMLDEKDNGIPSAVLPFIASPPSTNASAPQEQSPANSTQESAAPVQPAPDNQQSQTGEGLEPNVIERIINAVPNVLQNLKLL